MKDFVLYYNNGFSAAKLASGNRFSDFFASAMGYKIVEIEFEKHNIYTYSDNCVMKMNIKVSSEGVKIEPTRMYGGY